MTIVVLFIGLSNYKLCTVFDPFSFFPRVAFRSGVAELLTES